MNGPKPPVKARTNKPAVVAKQVLDDDEDDMDNLKSTYSMRITSTKSTTVPNDLMLSSFVAPTPRTARKQEQMPNSSRTLGRFSTNYDDDPFQAEPTFKSSSSTEFKTTDAGRGRNGRDDTEKDDAKSSRTKKEFHHRRRGDPNAARREKENTYEEKENNFTSPRFRQSLRDRHPAQSQHASLTTSSYAEPSGDTLHRRAVIPVSPRRLSIDGSGSENEVPQSFEVYPNSEFRTPRSITRDNNAPAAPLFIPSLDLEGKFASSNQESNLNSAPLTGIFSLENRSVDLILEEKCLKWKFINERNKVKGVSTSQKGEIELSKVFSVEPKQMVRRATSSSRKKSSKSERARGEEDEIFIDGFILHLFENEKPNVHRHKTIVFIHPHRETCLNWVENIKARIPCLRNERKIIVFLNPFAGEKKTRSIFKHTIAPILYAAEISFQIIEFHDTCNLRDSLVRNRIILNDYYGILILAGDSAVSKTINIIIELQARRFANIFEMRAQLHPPLCIVPVGSTNMIANSIYGTTDLETPLMYLLYGVTMSVDICSIYTNGDKLHSFGFGFSCGFGTSVARYLQRFSKLGTNKVQTSFARGAAKQRHKVIDIEIEYRRNNFHQPSDAERCYNGCTVCQFNKSTKHLSDTDNVERFGTKDEPMTGTLNMMSSRKKPAFEKSEISDEWEVIRGAYMHVSLLSNATLWDLATGGGLSKYAHLGDGCIDIVLVEPVSRKDFYRFLRRHTNAKDQLGLPFVHSVRVSEAKIRVLNTSNHLTNNSFVDDYYLNSSAQWSGANSMNRMGTTPRALTSRSHTARTHLEDETGSYPTQQYNSETESVDNNHEYSYRSTNGWSKGKYRQDLSSSMHDETSQAPLKTYDRSNQLPNQSLYYIESLDRPAHNQFNHSYQAEYGYVPSQDYNLNESMPPMTPMTARKPPNPKSLFKKSKSIVDLFKYANQNNKQKNEHRQERTRKLSTSNSIMDPSDSEYDPASYPSYPGRNNFNSSASFKSPEVWNCDWNLNMLPEMHIKCHRQFLPVFAAGVDPMTEYQESLTACLPGF